MDNSLTPKIPTINLIDCQLVLLSFTPESL